MEGRSQSGLCKLRQWPPLLGEVRLLGPLDYELQKFHRLTVLLTDHSQDQDPTCHRSGSCTITIEVEVIEPRSLGKNWKEFISPSGLLLLHSVSGSSTGWLERGGVSLWKALEPVA